MNDHFSATRPRAAESDDGAKDIGIALYNPKGAPAIIGFAYGYFILATPCAFLAQDYALLPRISRYLDADDCLIVPRRFIVKFFVTSDVITFVAQLAGTALTVVGAFIDGYENIGRIRL
ncbi:hypothetical protein QFC20_001663 [Naganishia adeliensis]|uniref:Uncharacterized protein n=1 Tax=Naganishia adeliensis TaxID=92952 RepID=A0ACC2WSY0_9TREE|nr:hypothetical protein QFC20_001663 [Naganishia adeliensis]